MLVAAAILLAALMLRLHGLGVQDLWLDETLAVDEATASAGRLRRAIEENTGPVYFLVLRAAIALGGTGETWVRLPSAVAGALFVGAVIWAGRELFTPGAGLWAGAVAALSPIHVYYSQEARVYALLTLCLTLAAATLWRALATGAARWWAGFAGCALAALYSHYLAVLPLAAAVLPVACWPSSAGARVRRRGFGLAVLAVGLLLAPWLGAKVLLAHPAAGVHGIDWIRQAWAQTPPWLALPKTLEVFAVGPQAGLLPVRLKQLGEVEFPAWLRLAGLIGSMGLAAWGLGPWGPRLGIPWLRLKQAWLLVFLAGPLLALWLGSFIVRPLYVAGRYDLVAFPVWPLAVGLGLAKLGGPAATRRAVVAAAALLVMAPSAAKLARYYEVPAVPSDGRTIARLLDSRVGDGDVVVFTGPRGVAILYYLHRLGYRQAGEACVAATGARRFGCRLFPRERERQPAVLDRRRVVLAPDTAREDAADFLRDLRGGSVWVVVDAGAIEPDRLRLPRPDAFLVAELGRRGLRYEVVSASLGVLRLSPA